MGGDTISEMSEAQGLLVDPISGKKIQTRMRVSSRIDVSLNLIL
jgi:hypothetical protein